VTHGSPVPVASSESARAAARNVVHPLPSGPVDGPESRVAARAGFPKAIRVRHSERLVRAHTGQQTGTAVPVCVQQPKPCPESDSPIGIRIASLAFVWYTPRRGYLNWRAADVATVNSRECATKTKLLAFCFDNLQTLH
jgi:hypothetical protein